MRCGGEEVTESVNNEVVATILAGSTWTCADPSGCVSMTVMPAVLLTSVTRGRTVMAASSDLDLTLYRRRKGAMTLGGALMGSALMRAWSMVNKLSLTAKFDFTVLLLAFG